jgi:hypothetical protein
MAQTQTGNATPQPTVISTSNIGSSTDRDQRSGGGRSAGQGTAEQVRGLAQDAASRASETWEGLSDRGTNYYRHGGRVAGELNRTSIAALLTAGVIGFALAWLTFHKRPPREDYIGRRMSQTGEHHI